MEKQRRSPGEVEQHLDEFRVVERIALFRVTSPRDVVTPTRGLVVLVEFGGAKHSPGVELAQFGGCDLADTSLVAGRLRERSVAATDEHVVRSELHTESEAVGTCAERPPVSR